MITNDMVSLAAGPTDLRLLTVLTDVLALPLVGAAGEQVRRWRDGTSEMGIEKLEKLCRYYHVSADYILGLPRDLDWPRG